MEFRWSIYSKS